MLRAKYEVKGGTPQPLHGKHNHTAVRGWVLLFILLLLAPAQAFCDSINPDQLTAVEFEAAFLSKIPAYVKWPKDSLKDARVLTIGVLGDDPVAPLLRKLLESTTIQGRTVDVETLTNVTALRGCQVVFVPRSSQSDWRQFIATNKAFGVLTVGDSDDFTKDGGVFALRVADRKLVINRENAKAAGLEISSKLLKMSIVER